MPDEPTNPGFKVPSAEGTIAKAGTQPLPRWLDLNEDGTPDWEQKWFRDSIGGTLFRLLAVFFPQSPWALVLKNAEPEIQALLDKGAK